MWFVLHGFILVETGNPPVGTLANSQDTDEMQHNESFYHFLHCLLRHNRSSKKQIKIFSKL